VCRVINCVKFILDLIRCRDWYGSVDLNPKSLVSVFRGLTLSLASNPNPGADTAAAHTESSISGTVSDIPERDTS